MRKLSSKRLDAAIFSGGEYGVSYNAKAAGVDRSDLWIAPKPIASEFNYLGIPKNLKSHDPVALKDALDAEIKQLKEDGAIAKILDAYR